LRAGHGERAGALVGQRAHETRHVVKGEDEFAPRA